MRRVFLVLAMLLALLGTMASPAMAQGGYYDRGYNDDHRGYDDKDYNDDGRGYDDDDGDYYGHSPRDPQCGWYLDWYWWNPHRAWWEYWCWWPGWGWEFVFWVWA